MSDAATPCSCGGSGEGGGNLVSPLGTLGRGASNGGRASRAARIWRERVRAYLQSLKRERARGRHPFLPRLHVPLHGGLHGELSHLGVCRFDASPRAENELVWPASRFKGRAYPSVSSRKPGSTRACWSCR
jgi:hypothetical protein